MIIKPKCKKFICVNSHPVGCALNVKEEISRARARKLSDGPMNVLVIGSSNGFGLSARICAAWSMGANTMGVFSSRPPRENREATSGWYNSYALAQELKTLPGIHSDLNEDAFATETKEKAIEMIRRDFPDGLDLVIYSIAAGRRKVGDDLFKSYIKPVGQSAFTPDLDLDTGIIRQVELSSATEEEIRSTQKVMGGEDWELWIRALNDAGVLKDGSKTFAFTYIGSHHTRAIYNAGTIGLAKDHLAQTAERLTGAGITRAHVVSQPAVVTQSSSVIPSISLYMTLLMDIYRQRNYDNSIGGHIARMMEEAVLADHPDSLIMNNTYELSPEIQSAMDERWSRLEIGSALPSDLGDPEAFRSVFLNLFGFGRSDVDYDQDVEHLLIGDLLGESR